MNQLSSIEEQLNTAGYIVHTNKGSSMMPLLREGKDLMIIYKRGKDRLKKYDAVLFKRDNGQYVMHRIVKVRKDDYLIIGDNCVQKEYVDDHHIIGVLKGVIRDGKTIKSSDFKYRLYAHIWTDFYMMRILLLRIRIFLARLKHSLMKGS